MTQLTRAYVSDQSSDPVEGVLVAFHRISTGETFFATSLPSGEASLGLEEDDYSVSVSANDFISPPASVFEVSVPPGPTPAVFNPPAQSAPQSIDASNKSIQISVDGTSYTIDVSGGDNEVADANEIATNINTAVGATVATAVQGEIRLESTTTGSSSEVTVFNSVPLADDATDIVFGLELGTGDVTITGEDTPTDWNDFDLTVTAVDDFSATDPNHCVLWSRFWRHELTEPLSGATVSVLVLERPAAIDVGLDVGDSFYATTDKEGYLKFELMRGSKIRVHIIWQDKVFEFKVPDKPSANIDTLVAPVVEDLEIKLADAISLNVGTEKFLSVKKIFSDGSDKTDVKGVTFISTNTEVASFDPNRPRVLIANQASPPTTVIRAEFKNTRGEVIQSQDVTVTVV